MEESSSEEELPLLRTQTSLRLETSRRPSAEALAEISIARAKEQRKLQLRNLIAISGVTLLIGTGIPTQYTVNEVLFAIPTEIRETVFIIHASFLGAFVLGGLLITPLLIAYLGLRNTLIYDCLAICIYLYISYIPSLVTLVPLGVVAGQALQCAHTSYLLILTQVSHLYLGTHITSEGHARDFILHSFSGVFHTSFLAGPVLRSLFELLFLQKETSDNVIGENDTMICNKLDCAWKNGDVILRDVEYFDTMLPTFNLRRLQALLGIVSVLAVGALFILTLCFAVPHRMETQNICKTTKLFILSTWKMWQTDYLFLLPTMMFIGMEETVALQVISKNYIACQHGWTSKQLFILCVSGVATALCFPLAVMSSYIGRVKTTIAGHFVFVILLVTLCVWIPDWDDKAALFLIGSLWGLANALLRIQVPMMLEGVFQRHCVSAASFSNVAIGLGMLGTVLFQHYLCTQVVFTACLVAVIISTITYIVYEIRQALHAKEIKLTDTKSELTLPDLDHPSWLPELDPHTSRTRTSLFGRQ